MIFYSIFDFFPFYLSIHIYLSPFTFIRFTCTNILTITNNLWLSDGHYIQTAYLLKVRFFILHTFSPYYKKRQQVIICFM